jgi:DNA repair exonuclease SbcCD nuclease subunit
MKIWFLADLHFGCRADNEIWLKDYSDYFYNVFIPLFKEKYVEGDIVCSLGDVFDNRSSVGINTINVVIDIFEKIADICPDIRLIVGNHDIYNKSTNDITSFISEVHAEHYSNAFGLDEAEILSEDDIKEEEIMLSLRTSAGISISSLSPQMKKFVESGLAKYQNGSFSLTDKGFFVSNSIIYYLCKELLYDKR